MTGAELTTRRRHLDLSQEELSRLLDVTPNTVARWERGELTIAHPALLTLALDQLVRRYGATAEIAAQDRRHAYASIMRAIDYLVEHGGALYDAAGAALAAYQQQAADLDARMHALSLAREDYDIADRSGLEAARALLAQEMAG